jgi:hypothetical protein
MWAQTSVAALAQEQYAADNEGAWLSALVDRETISENFGGRAWGLAGLALAILNGVVLVVSVQVLGTLGINVHFAYRNRVPRFVNLYLTTLACSLLAPLVVGVVGLFVDRRKGAAGWAVAACVLVFALYGCAAE